MDANELDRIARIVADKTRRKYRYFDRNKQEELVSEAFKLLLRSVHLQPWRTAEQHVRVAVRSPAKNYYNGFGRNLFQTTREAAARKPGRRAPLPLSERN